MSLNEDFLDILAALTDAGADFLVVGAHALAIHGVSRATGDLDVLVRASPENALRVYRALQDFGAPVHAHGLTTDDLATEGVVYQMGLPPRRIDILTRIDGVSFDEAWFGRELQVVEGLDIPFLGRAELLANKRTAGRPKDLLDVELLMESEG